MTHGTARLEREAAFHDARFGGAMMRDAQEKYYAAVAHGREAFEARVQTLSRGARVLEVGCGTGGELARLAGGASDAVGLDLSAEAVGQARASRPDLRFETGDAAATRFEDGAFDLVFGAGIVHHLDVEAFGAEVRRLLAPGGRAVFWEPLGHNAAVNLYRRMTPAARTPDERPLRKADLAMLARAVGPLRTSVYGLTTIPGAVLPQGRVRTAYLGVAAGLDRALLRVPGLKFQAWYALIEIGRA